MNERQKMEMRQEIAELVAIERYGKSFDEIYEFQQDGICQIWNIKRRDVLEKYLW